MKTRDELKGMLKGEISRLAYCKEQMKERKRNLITVKARVDLLKYLIDKD